MRAPLSPKAIKAFATLTPQEQVLILSFIARFTRVKPSSMFSTDAQRQAHREWTAREKEREQASTAYAAARRRVIMQLDELRARINRRRAGAWGTVEMTTAERRRRERLYGELNRLDGVA